MSTLQISSLSGACLFTFPWHLRGFNFDEVEFTIFNVIPNAFLCPFWKIVFYSGFAKILPCVLSSSFIVLTFTSIVISNECLCLVWGRGQGSLFPCLFIQLFQHHLLKILSSIKLFWCLVENYLTLLLSTSISALHAGLLIYLSVFRLIINFLSIVF